MTTFLNLLKYTCFGFNVDQLLLALACIVGGFVLRWLFMLVLRWMLKHAENTATAADDIIIGALSAPLGALCIVLGIWVGLKFLPIPTEPYDAQHLIGALLKAALKVLAVWFLLRLNERGGRRAHERAMATNSPVADVVPLARKTIRVLLILVAGLIVLQELGYSVTSLIAGLGLGGLAIGLAARDTLANFFGGVAIFVDRPFARGNWIKIGEVEGIVEDIGVRVTRVRTFQDSLITLPNAMFTTTAINNFTRMRKRRIRLVVSVTYDATPAQLEAAVTRLQKLIVDDKRFDAQDITVALQELSTYSLNILVVCFVLTTDYQKFMQAQQELLLAIMKLLAELKLELAYPTQTLLQAKDSNDD
jgi:MscS family membrane protein